MGIDDFTGKVALVTGAAKGMGAAIAAAFVQAGGSVGALDPDGEALAATVAALGERALPIVGDAGRDADAERAVRDTVAAFGGLDVLVNNAGIARLGPIDTFSEADWDAVFDVNVKAQFLTARHAIPRLRERGSGTIVNVASVQAYWSQGGSFAYSASKAASVGFTRALSLDHAREGIRVVGIAPGSVRTPMLLSEAQRMVPEDPEGALRSWAAAHPIGRLIEPEDIARLTLFLCGEGAAALSGATVLADGGLLAGNAGW